MTTTSPSASAHLDAVYASLAARRRDAQAKAASRGKRYLLLVVAYSLPALLPAGWLAISGPLLSGTGRGLGELALIAASALFVLGYLAVLPLVFLMERSKTPALRIGLAALVALPLGALLASFAVVVVGAIS